MARIDSPKALALAVALLAGALATASAAGTIRWVARARPITTTPAFAPGVAPVTQGPEEDANLASIQRGAVVRASSWDWFRRHHPLFVIDGEPQPTLVEKWASVRADRAPWIEVRLALPALVRRVVLVFATERASPVVRSYTLRCLANARPLAGLRIDDNERAVVSHDLFCEGADVIRLELEVTNDVARLYEIEVWGHP